MTYANIKLEQHKVTSVKDDGTKVETYPEPRIHEFMKPFVEALALKYPHYEFVECDARTAWGARDDERYYVADGFKVMDKREELGKIRVDHWCRTGERFWIDNFRIDAQKTRGRGFKTKHMDKAMKYVAKYFGSRNTEELMDEAEKQADNVRGNINTNLSLDIRRLWNTLDDYAAQFMVDNWDNFSNWLKANADAAVQAIADKYPEAQQRKEEARKISDLIDRGKAQLVFIQNSDYIVRTGEGTKIMASEELPAIVRRNLGMLKLVQDRELLTNIGIRVNESTYYVVGENNE